MTEADRDRAYRKFEANVEAAEAAETREEKLAIMERSMPPDDARCFVERMLDPDAPFGCLHVIDDKEAARRAEG